MSPDDMKQTLGLISISNTFTQKSNPIILGILISISIRSKKPGLNSERATIGSLCVLTWKELLLPPILFASSNAFLNVRVMSGSLSTIRIRLVKGDNHSSSCCCCPCSLWRREILFPKCLSSPENELIFE
jgi:hypothetical protein